MFFDIKKLELAENFSYDIALKNKTTLRREKKAVKKSFSFYNPEKLYWWSSFIPTEASSAWKKPTPPGREYPLPGPPARRGWGTQE